MNNAIGLNLPVSPSADIIQSTTTGEMPLPQSCTKGDCLVQGDEGFLEVLNAELEALTKPEMFELMRVESAETLGINDKPNDFGLADLALKEPLLKQDTPIEEIALKDSIAPEVSDKLLIEVDAEIKSALAELPKEIVALPLTPENKAFIQQQILDVVRKNNPELINKFSELKGKDGQELPIAGKVLPLIEEALITPNQTKIEQTVALGSTSMVSNALPKESLGIAAEKFTDIAETDTELDSEFELMLKESTHKGDSIPKELVNNKSLEAVVNRTTTQADVMPQKFSTEAVSTPLNNVLGANQASVNTPTTTAVQTGTSLLLPQNPSPEQWGSALGDKVQWMINTKLDSAEIRIDPPHLGKMEVSIKMTEDGAQVVIQTQHAATRELVDAASYRLKEMLEEAGHEHVDVDVTHQEDNSTDNQFADNDDSDNEPAARAEAQESQSVTTDDVIAGTVQNGRTRLDIFA